MHVHCSSSLDQVWFHVNPDLWGLCVCIVRIIRLKLLMFEKNEIFKFGKMELALWNETWWFLFVLRCQRLLVIVTIICSSEIASIRSWLKSNYGELDCSGTDTNYFTMQALDTLRLAEAGMCKTPHILWQTFFHKLCSSERTLYSLLKLVPSLNSCCGGLVGTLDFYNLCKSSHKSDSDSLIHLCEEGHF